MGGQSKIQLLQIALKEKVLVLQIGLSNNPITKQWISNLFRHAKKIYEFGTGDLESLKKQGWVTECV